MEITGSLWKGLLQVPNCQEPVGGGPGVMCVEFAKGLSVNHESVPVEVMWVQFTWEIEELFTPPRALLLGNSGAAFH